MVAEKNLNFVNRSLEKTRISSKTVLKYREIIAESREFWLLIAIKSRISLNDFEMNMVNLIKRKIEKKKKNEFWLIANFFLKNRRNAYRIA